MEIKGLPRFQQKALEKHLAGQKIDGYVKIHFNDSISLLRLSSLWHNLGVVDITYKRYTFHIEARGDVRAYLHTRHYERQLCYVKDRGNNGNFAAEMLSYIRSDKALADAIGVEPRLYCLEMCDNNWWECVVTTPQGELYDPAWALDDNLFVAITEVIGGLNEIIKGIEEAA